MTTAQFKIEAKEHYLNSEAKNLFSTNIDLNCGDLFKISSTAEFQKVGISYKYDSNTANPDFEFPVGSLIGTVDGGTTFFPVVGNVEMMYLDEMAGKLSLVFWGVDASTAKGSATVTVEVEKERAKNEIKAATENNETGNSFFQDRFQFAVHANANSIWRKTNPSYPSDLTDTYNDLPNIRILEPLLETGILLQPGDLLLVDVPPLDLWSPDGGFYANANSISEVSENYRWGYGRMIIKGHSYRIGNLIATLDDGKTFFPVGTHLQMTVLNAGMLAFAYWDWGWNNNYGFVKACVKVIRNGQVLTNLDIKTISVFGNGSSSSSETKTLNRIEIDVSNLDCTNNLPKLSDKLQSDLSIA